MAGTWTLTAGLAAAAAVLFAAQCFWTWYRLRHVPGPFWSRLTDIPRVRWVLSNRAHDIHTGQHRKYGPVVRFGPNMVSISDPAEIGTIYGFRASFVKSDFYHVLLFTVKGKGVPGLFATQDEHLHRTLKRPIASIYSMSNLVSFEPLVDSTIRYFFARLDESFVATSQACDFDRWLQMFAFDTMGEITFSSRLGFLESGDDVNHIMANIWRYFARAAPVTQMPWLDRVWTKNPLVQRLRRAAPPNPIVRFAMERLAERQAMSPDAYAAKAHLYRRDFLTRLRDAHDATVAKAPGLLPPWAFSAWLTSNITAGSDTIAILLRTIVHQLVLRPEAMARLRAELEEAAAVAGKQQGDNPEGNGDDGDSDPIACTSWATVARASVDLPFLDAVIKESGRWHPSFGLPLERVVPPEGVTVCGSVFLPGGTVVGMSPWVIGRDERVFGDKVDEWRPERWLEADEAQRKLMENSILTFGAGHRVCLGKNIALLEVYKLVPSLVMRYDLEFADPMQTSMHVENRWFVNQTGLRLKLRRRTPAYKIR